MDTIELSIIIPAYNEEERLPAALEAVGAYLKGQNRRAEVIVVDDGSADRTAELAEDFAGRLDLRLIRNERNRGKGYSIRRGMLAAQGRWRLFCDADLSTPIEELDKLLASQGSAPPKR